MRPFYSNPHLDDLDGMISRLTDFLLATTDTGGVSDMVSFTLQTRRFDTACLTRQGKQALTRLTWDIQHDRISDTIGPMLTRGFAVVLRGRLRGGAAPRPTQGLDVWTAPRGIDRNPVTSNGNNSPLRTIPAQLWPQVSRTATSAVGSRITNCNHSD